MVDNYGHNSTTAKNLSRQFIGGVAILAAVLVFIAAVGWGTRLTDLKATVFVVAILAAVVALYVRNRVEHGRGYSLFWQGIHFDRAWSRARITGWCDAMMDSDERTEVIDLGPRR